MKGRSVNSGTSYAYGFNGKRKDPEGMGGGGATYDYGFRIYNPNLGKFLSVDPLTKSYLWYTPYQFAGNMPISAIDLDGEEIKVNTGQGNVQIQAMYGIITSGPGAIIITAKEIEKMEIDIALILNNNLGTSIKIKDISDPIARDAAVREAKMGAPELSYGEILEKDACALVQFCISLFDAGESKINSYGGIVNSESANKLYLKDKDGSSISDGKGNYYKLGGVLIMGTNEVLKKAGLDPAKVWDNVDEKGNPVPNGTPAFYTGDKIFLNPSYYDKTDPNYQGFSATNNSEVGEITHEIGHDLNLNHGAIYPKEGIMSTTPENSGATPSEIQQILETVPLDPRP